MRKEGEDDGAGAEEKCWGKMSCREKTPCPGHPIALSCSTLCRGVGYEEVKPSFGGEK